MEPLPTCTTHPDRAAEDRCARCGAYVCATCTTHRHEIPLCPSCIVAGGVVKRDLEHEAHLQAIGVVDYVLALVLVAWLARASWIGPVPDPWTIAGVAIGAALCVATGWGLRRYYPLAAGAQVLLGAILVACPLVRFDFSHLSTAVSAACLGGIAIWAVLSEYGRECFSWYYREIVKSSRESPGFSFVTVLALVLGALEAFFEALRTT